MPQWISCIDIQLDKSMTRLYAPLAPPVRSCRLLSFVTINQFQTDLVTVNFSLIRTLSALWNVRPTPVQSAMRPKPKTLYWRRGSATNSCGSLHHFCLSVVRVLHQILAERKDGSSREDGNVNCQVKPRSGSPSGTLYKWMPLSSVTVLCSPLGLFWAKVFGTPRACTSRISSHLHVTGPVHPLVAEAKASIIVSSCLQV